MFYILSVVEFSGEAHGVLREAWYKLNNFDLNGATMRDHSVFETPPESQIILRDFDAPVDVAEKYVQRLTSFLQVNPRFNKNKNKTKQNKFVDVTLMKSGIFVFHSYCWVFFNLVNSGIGSFNLKDGYCYYTSSGSNWGRKYNNSVRFALKMARSPLKKSCENVV